MPFNVEEFLHLGIADLGVKLDSLRKDDFLAIATYFELPVTTFMKKSEIKSIVAKTLFDFNYEQEIKKLEIEERRFDLKQKEFELKLKQREFEFKISSEVAILSDSYNLNHKKSFVSNSRDSQIVSKGADSDTKNSSLSQSAFPVGFKPSHQSKGLSPRQQFGSFDSSSTPRCGYCKKQGHILSECFKLKHKKELDKPQPHGCFSEVKTRHFTIPNSRVTSIPDSKEFTIPDSQGPSIPDFQDPIIPVFQGSTIPAF